MNSEFDVSVSQVRAGVKITVRGELDIAAVGALVSAREQALAGEPEWVVIDLGAVPFVDSSGLKFLLETHAQAQRAGWNLQLLKPAPTAMRVFTVTGTHQHLPFIDLDE